MATLTLVGVLAGRPRSTGSILAAAVLFLLILDPWLVWAIGFQLSVAATAGMVVLATPLAERLRFLPKPVALAAGTTLAAQFGVTPLLLFHFHEVPGLRSSRIWPPSRPWLRRFCWVCLPRSSASYGCPSGGSSRVWR
jgi:ComEC/Rec2-related protein